MHSLFSCFRSKSSPRQRRQRDTEKADWSLLPPNLVNYVAALLSVADQARMASTCEPWRQAMADGFWRTPQKPSIWFLSDLSNRCEFQSFSKDLKRTYFFSMPLAKFRILGSSRGWLMLEDESTRLHSFNPITRTTLSFPISGCRQPDLSGAIRKAVFVQRKGLPVMAAIMRRAADDGPSFMELAVAEPGDDAWTPLVSPPCTLIADIAAYEGQLYVINKRTEILVYDLRGKKLTSLCPAAKIGVKRSFGLHLKNYLGIVSGVLVLVRLRICPHCTINRSRYLSQIEVLKLDSTGKDDWVTLKGLDGHAILVDYYGILVLPAGEFKELEADCVYSLNRKELSSKAGLTVLNFVTKNVSFRRLSIAKSLSPLWFLPNRDEFLE